jgi:hypothetical protein
MSDTQRVDAVVKIAKKYGKPGDDEVVDVDFARQLERELAEALAAARPE